MTSSDIFKHAIFYPQIEHPLLKESSNLKSDYVNLLEYYAHQCYGKNVIIDARISSLRKILLPDMVTDLSTEFDFKSVAKTILKTHFSLFRWFFSYRYIFLFDSLLLLAPDNEIAGNIICKSLKYLVSERHHKKLDTMVEKMYANDASFAEHDFITHEMVDAWESVQNYQKASNKNIVFTATISAGKSTLINALVGEELSFAKKAACTATVVNVSSAPLQNRNFNIISNNGMFFNLNEQQVRSFTKTLDKPCKIVGHFNSLFGKIKVTLIDTPGVDSAQNLIHKDIARNELKYVNVDLLLYVIAVENYGATDDHIHLQFIKSQVKYKKILFIINMMDTCDLEDDSVEEIVNNVARYLRQMGFENPMVCPLSAKAGLLLKKLLIGYSMSKNDLSSCDSFISEFCLSEMDLSKYYPVVHEAEIFSSLKIKNQKEHVNLIQAYISTGLPGLEKLILSIVEAD
jgi:GTPase SAR1 family protein